MASEAEYGYVDTCTKCMALVSNTNMNKHIEWHNKISKEIARAGGPLGILFEEEVEV